MTSTTSYPKELRARAVRLVLEHGGEYPPEWAAVESIAAKLGMTRETLSRWVGGPRWTDGTPIVLPELGAAERFKARRCRVT
jgi:transposase